MPSLALLFVCHVAFKRAHAPEVTVLVDGRQISDVPAI